MTSTVTVNAAARQITLVSDQLNSAASVVVGTDTVPFTIPKNVPAWTGVTPALVSTDGHTPSTTNVYSY